ncbi:MAG TPA: cytochrome P460 family protein [Pyrinomonadaceae bacterium]|jgi:hypothetical protein
MILNLQKSKTVIVTVWLVLVLAFFITQLVKGAITSARPHTLSATKQVKEIEGYRNWTKVNSVPQLMPGRVAAACAIWQSSSGVAVDGTSNPHRNKYFTVYVNAVGRKAMLNQKQPKFPEGSIIVKEKLSATDSRTPELLTVMIKQKEGFNPASGDWEYMVIDGTGTKVEGRGNLQNCQSCHIGNQRTDYIFRTYLSEGVESKLK